MSDNHLESILTQKNLTTQQKKVVFLGIVAESIFDKKLFKHNVDLHVYINLFERILDLDTYLPYVYKARPLLASRVISKINSTEDTVLLNKLFVEHTEIIKKISDSEIKSDKTKKSYKSKANKKTSLLHDVINKGK